MNFTKFKEEYQKLQTPEERKNFIRTRVESLLATTEPTRIGLDLTGSYNGFISPTMGVCSNASEVFADLKMDDLDVYEEFMAYIKDDIDKYLRSEPTTIYTIQHFIWNYFGYNAGAIFPRMDFYSQGAPVSIKELRGKNMAACSERSAMVQNILKFLGFDSEIIFGKLNKDESHAYIIFKPEGKNIRILYDPMNPVEYIEDSQKYYCAGVSRMSEEQYDELQNGGAYTFNYDLVKKVFIPGSNCVEDERVYTSDAIKFKKSVVGQKPQQQLEETNNQSLDDDQGGIKR